ncbi:MAG TPA: hypothetical protein VJR90_00025 [Gammaproteobacteria bacterium]|nr:hypothetical protein [Gammaproteobacteria bacterium]
MDYLTVQQTMSLLLALVGVLWSLVQLAVIGWVSLVWWELRRLRDRSIRWDTQLARIEAQLEAIQH